MTIYYHETLDPVREPSAHTRNLQELVHTEGTREGSTGAGAKHHFSPLGGCEVACRNRTEVFDDMTALAAMQL